MQSTRVAGLAGMLLCATAQAGTTTLTVRDAAAGQGNSFYTPLLFTIERTGDLSYPVEVEFMSEPDPEAADPAVPDVDFLASHITSYVLPAGEAHPTIPVSLLRAQAGRPDRGIVVRILNVGIPRFEPRQDVCQGGGVGALAVADFNADGLPDLAAALNEGGLLYLCTNRSADGELAFSEPKAVQAYVPGASTYYDNLTGVAAGDLDGDGRTDLVVSNGSQNKVLVFANRTPDLAESPEFEVVQVLPTFNRAGTLALADFDGDGRLDIAAGGEIGSCPQGSFEDCTSDLYLFANATAEGATAPSFEALPPLLTRMFVYRILAKDFTDDGRPDLVAVTSAGVDLFRNTAEPGSALSFAPRAEVMTAEMWASDIDAADLDGDDRLDLAVVHENEVSVLTGLGGGAFADLVRVYIEPVRESGHQENPHTVRALDFNNDRKVDLAIGNSLADIPGSLVTLLENRTAPGVGYRFPTDVELRVAGAPNEFSVIDVDADGRDDIVTPSYYDRRVSVLRRADNAADLPRPFGRGTALATLAPLEFAPVTGAPTSASVSSEEAVISGISYAAPMTLSQGAYTVNGVSRAGTTLVRAGDVVRLEVQTAAGANAQSKAAAMVGGVGAEFSVTTAAAVEAPAAASGGGPLSPWATGLLALAALARRSARGGVFQ